MSWLGDPGVITGIIALLGVIASPFIASRIKRRENGRVAAQAAEALRIEATEKRLRDLLDRQAAEITGLRTRLEEQEEKARAAEERETRMLRRQDRMLAALGDVARELRDELEGDKRQALAARMVKAITHARDFFDGRETA